MASGDELTKAKLTKIRALVQSIPDFPKPGILFRDIFPVFRDAAILKDLISVMEDHIKATNPEVDVLVGLEARGFLLAPLLSCNIGCSFVPIRKKGKLPGDVVSLTFSLEYGTDTFEIQKDSIKPGQKVIIVDDLLATGGTMKAACDLVSQMEGDVVECIAVLELVDLQGRKKVPKPCTTFLEF